MPEKIFKVTTSIFLGLCMVAGILFADSISTEALENAINSVINQTFKKRHLYIIDDNSNDNSKVEDEVRKEVVDLCSKFPIYKNLR